MITALKTKIQVNKFNKLIKNLTELTKKQILVGVSEDESARKNPDQEGNATIAYIHDNGSPLRRIPARPFMEPGIRNAQDAINLELTVVAKAQLESNKEKVDLYLNRVGLVAQNSIRKVITDGEGFTPLKRGTKLERLKRRKSYAKWSEEKKERYMGSMKPLIDTGQLRNSITYVVVDK